MLFYKIEFLFKLKSLRENLDSSNIRVILSFRITFGYFHLHARRNFSSSEKKKENTFGGKNDMLTKT